MLKIDETNITGIRETAKAMLFLDIAETKLPFVASHPFTNTWITGKNSKDGFTLIDLHDSKMLMEWRESKAKEIDNSNLLHIFMMMNKPYYLTFIKFVESHLNREELGEILREVWCMIEQISGDVNVSSRDIIRMFKKADKKYLMSDMERSTIESMPSLVTVYRGVTSYNRKNKNALSWTIDREKAEWFSNRFQTGTGEVWSLKIPKNLILCYFGERGTEEEVIIDVFNADMSKVVITKNK